MYILSLKNKLNHEELLNSEKMLLNVITLKILLNLILCKFLSQN